MNRLFATIHFFSSLQLMEDARQGTANDRERGERDKGDRYPTLSTCTKNNNMYFIKVNLI